MTPTAARVSSSTTDERDGAGVVNRGRRVRHANDGSEATARRRRRAAGDIFFRGLARFAEMDVQVNQAGRNDFSRGVENFNPLWRGKIFADRGNFSVKDENVRRRIEFVRGVNHASAGQKQRIHWRESSAARLTRQARALCFCSEAGVVQW